jgi:trigger factor
MEMRESGMPEEEIKARERMLQRDVLSSTAQALKEHFVLQKVAEIEKLEIENRDIDEEIERIAETYGESPRRIRAQFEREDLLETLAAQLIERKALDLILDSAEYEEVPIGKEGGMATTEAQAVPGEMKDPTAAPPEEKAEGEPQE